MADGDMSPVPNEYTFSDFSDIDPDFVPGDITSDDSGKL